MASDSMDDLSGWVEIDCKHSDAIRDYDDPSGGLGPVSPRSSFTNMEWSELGRPMVYTEWERAEKPILRDYLDPSGERECKHYAREGSLDE